MRETHQKSLKNYVASFTARLWGREYLKLLIICCSSFDCYFVVFFRLYFRRKLSIFLDNFLFQPNLQMVYCQIILFYSPLKNSVVWVTVIWDIIYWFSMINGIKYWLNKIDNENVKPDTFGFALGLWLFFMTSYCLLSFPSNEQSVSFVCVLWIRLNVHQNKKTRA